MNEVKLQGQITSDPEVKESRMEYLEVLSYLLRKEGLKIDHVMIIFVV